MPEWDNSWFRYDSVTDHREKGRIYIISTDVVYRKIFWKYTYTDDSLKKYKKQEVDPWWYQWMQKHHIDSVPVIDFSKNELVVYAACAQCLAICDLDKGNGPCHRSACSYQEAWFTREKGQKNRVVTANYTSGDLWGIKTDSTCRFVSLPPLWPTDLYKIDEAGKRSSYHYLVGHDSLYYRIFSRYSRDSLPVFDFNKQELVVSVFCYYCSGLGTMDGSPRHRNACAYTAFFCVRDKQPAKKRVLSRNEFIQ